MGEVTGQKVAGMFPKTLETMLNILILENGLRSWSIYDDKFGVSVRLRFDSGIHGSVADRVDIESSHARTITNNTYKKKTPSQIRRDSQRKTLRAKRQRLHSQNEVENERSNNDEQVQTKIDDTPVKVECKPPGDETLFMMPLTPIEIDLGGNESTCSDQHPDMSKEYERQDLRPQLFAKCTNCDESPEKCNHVCDDNTTIMSDDCDILSNKSKSSQAEFVAKNEKSNELRCYLSERSKWHSKEKLYRCKSCMLYLCLWCKVSKISNDPLYQCCENINITNFETEVPYVAYPP